MITVDSHDFNNKCCHCMSHRLLETTLISPVTTKCIASENQAFQIVSFFHFFFPCDRPFLLALLHKRKHLNQPCGHHWWRCSTSSNWSDRRDQDYYHSTVVVKTFLRSKLRLASGNIASNIFYSSCGFSVFCLGVKGVSGDGSVLLWI